MSLSHPLPRELTRPVFVGDVQMGGGAPVVVQSMTCTDTADAQATLAQVCALAQAGCDIVRVSVPTEAALEGFRTICAESPVPIIADIHFNHKLAIGAVEAGAAKLRINPGNIGDWAKVDAVIDAAGAAGCAIRIGVNAGSLEQDIAERDDLTQPEKLVMSSERFVKHFEDRGFTNIVLSAKAHSVTTTLDTYRALSREIPHHARLAYGRSGRGAAGRLGYLAITRSSPPWSRDRFVPHVRSLPGQPHSYRRGGHRAA